MFSTRQKRLVELLRGLPWHEADDALLYDGCDLDTEVELPAGLLAHLGVLQDWQHTPRSLRPRLQGLRKQRQVGHAMQLPDAERLFGAWQSQEIPWLLMGDAALRLISGTDYPFPAAHLSAFVDIREIPNALRQAEEAGFSVRLDSSVWKLQTRLCTVEVTGALPTTYGVLAKEIMAASTHRSLHGTAIPVIAAEHLLLLRMRETMLRQARILSPAHLLEECWEIGLLFAFVDWDKVDAAAPMLSDGSVGLCMAGVLSELFPLPELRALEAAILSHADNGRGVQIRAKRMRRMLEHGTLATGGHGGSRSLPARLRRKLARRSLLYLLGNNGGAR